MTVYRRFRHPVSYYAVACPRRYKKQADFTPRIASQQTADMVKAGKTMLQRQSYGTLSSTDPVPSRCRCFRWNRTGIVLSTLFKASLLMLEATLPPPQDLPTHHRVGPLRCCQHPRCCSRSLTHLFPSRTLFKPYQEAFYSMLTHVRKSPVIFQRMMVPRLLSRMPILSSFQQESHVSNAEALHWDKTKSWIRQARNDS